MTPGFYWFYAEAVDSGDEEDTAFGADFATAFKAAAKGKDRVEFGQVALRWKGGEP